MADDRLREARFAPRRRASSPLHERPLPPAPWRYYAVRMSWEAFRLTSKSPTEVLHILGPHGVDDLIRKAMDACWREYPESTRSYENVKRRMLEVYNRNMRHWSSIKKPQPAAFFDRLLPYTADGHMRQALVLTWMMMPRA